MQHVALKTALIDANPAQILPSKRPKRRRLSPPETRDLSVFAVVLAACAGCETESRTSPAASPIDAGATPTDVGITTAPPAPPEPIAGGGLDAHSLDDTLTVFVHLVDFEDGTAFEQPGRGAFVAAWQDGRSLSAFTDGNGVAVFEGLSSNDVNLTCASDGREIHSWVGVTSRAVTCVLPLLGRSRLPRRTVDIDLEGLEDLGQPGAFAVVKSIDRVYDEHDIIPVIKGARRRKTLILEGRERRTLAVLAGRGLSGPGSAFSESEFMPRVTKLGILPLEDYQREVESSAPYSLDQQVEFIVSSPDSGDGAQPTRYFGNAYLELLLAGQTSPTKLGLRAHFAQIEVPADFTVSAPALRDGLAGAQYVASVVAESVAAMTQPSAGLFLTRQTRQLVQFAPSDVHRYVVRGYPEVPSGLDVLDSRLILRVPETATAWSIELRLDDDEDRQRIFGHGTNMIDAPIPPADPDGSRLTPLNALEELLSQNHTGPDATVRHLDAVVTATEGDVESGMRVGEASWRFVSFGL